MDVNEPEAEVSAPSSEDEFHVVIKGAGLALDRHVTSDVALQLVTIVMGGSVTPHRPTSASRSTEGDAPQAVLSRAQNQRVPLRTFLTEANARSITSKIAAVGIYKHEFEGKAEFTREDVLEALRSAREALPANPHRDFNKAIQAGWIAEDSKNKSHFYVTPAGEAAFESKFEGVRAAPGRKRPGKRSASRKDGAVNGEL